MNLFKVSDPRRPTALDDLPVEILELIFLRCLLCEPRPSSIGLDWCPVNKRTAPLQISRYWRAVALGCPSLWAFLAVKCTPRTLRPNFPLIRTWLDRSKDHPFSFNIGARWNISFLEDIIPMFLAEFPRWHDVIIGVPEIPSSPSIHLPAGVTTAPLLVRLHVEVGGGRIPSFTEELLRGLPSLRTLSWKVPGIRGLFLLDNISWAQLTNLHLKCKLSVENCLFVLHRSTLLRHCHLETICTDEVISSQADHLSIKPSIHLQSLQIVANISFIPLLQVLNLPALESLTISATAPQARFVCSTSPSLLNLLRRSASPLRSLTLTDTQIYEDIIIEILELAPYLASLTIHDEIEDALNTPLSDNIIRSLVKRDVGTFACPGLRRLQLTGRVNSTSSIFVQMVEQRWSDKAVANQVASLESVNVEFRKRSHDYNEVLQVIKRLKSEGLSARVFVKSE